MEASPPRRRLGLLVVRIWLEPDQRPFARLTLKLDIADTLPYIRVVGTTEELLSEIQAWLHAIRFPHKSP
jgi:hypothetical protein